MSIYKTPFDIDPCPLCGEPVTSIKQEMVTPYSSLLAMPSTAIYKAYMQTIVKVGPCGHEVDCQTEGNKVKLFAKHSFDDSPNGQFQQFLVHLQALATSKGWQVYASTNGPSAQINLAWACPHGQQYGSIESWMSTTLAPLEFAQSCWHKIQGMCQCQNYYQSYWNTGGSIPSSWTFVPQAYQYNYGGSGGGGGTSILGELLSICPGLGTVRRPCPDKSGCEYTDASLPLSNLIQHVNDNHQWSREKIAEWLDIIAIDDPSVDLTVKPKSKQKKEIKRAKPSIGPSKPYEELIAQYAGTFTVDNTALLKEILGAGS